MEDPVLATALEVLTAASSSTKMSLILIVDTASSPLLVNEFEEI